MKGVLFQLVAFVKNDPFQLGKVEVSRLSKFLLHLLRQAHDDVSILEDCAVDSANFDVPLVCHVIEVTIGHQVVIYLGQKGLGRNNYKSLWSAYLVVFVLLKFLSDAGDILEGIEDGDEVGEGLACPVVGVDDGAKVAKVVLESDRQGLCLDHSGLVEVIVLQQSNDLFLQRVVLKLGLFRSGS